MGSVIIVIVGFRNADDVCDCFRALSNADPEPNFYVCVAENGGDLGMQNLIEKLDSVGGSSWRKEATVDGTSLLLPAGCRYSQYRLVRPDGVPGAKVYIAQTPENVGYAGGINFWLRRLLTVPDWDAVWILNPDTEPAPNALAELAAYARLRRKGMVGSCIVRTDQPNTVFTRGLAWRKFAARPKAIDRGAPIAVEPNADEVEARLFAPSGASVFVTRDLVERIGLMDERYFLYFEDLEWGCRAKRAGELGYAHRARVPHKCGTTIRGTAGRASRSPMSVYLQVRNSVLFVKANYPAWMIWTIFMQLVYIATYGAVGALHNMTVGFQGLKAGLRGETGRPETLLEEHTRWSG